jgi:heterodisulfide reductase subunit A
MRVGVFIGQVLRNDDTQAQAVAKYAANLPEVEEVRLLGFRPQLDAASLARDIRRLDLERIILAGDSPGYFKPLFTQAARMAGANPEEVRLASFREHGISSGDQTERAKAVLACAVRGVPFRLVAEPKPTVVHPATLVIGAGVAGIQAALEIADGGKKVYLVEKTATIGGHMAMFDKTFPTLDCAACILTPKMVMVGDHENIELFTYSEIQGVSGGPGAYRVRILQKARRVDVDSCVACNLCSQVCPASVASEFDSRLSQRKAIYIPFPQAVPNAYVVDAEHCLFLETDGAKCGACVKKCPKDCIHLDATDQVVEIDVGNIIRLRQDAERLDVPRVRAHDQRLRSDRREDRPQDQEDEQAHEEGRVGRRSAGSAAEERRHHPLRGVPRRQVQPVLLARLLHVLPQVRASSA